MCSPFCNSYLSVSSTNVSTKFCMLTLKTINFNLVNTDIILAFCSSLTLQGMLLVLSHNCAPNIMIKGIRWLHLSDDVVAKIV